MLVFSLDQITFHKLKKEVRLHHCEFTNFFLGANKYLDCGCGFVVEKS
jgi:hypothetical protein